MAQHAADAAATSSPEPSADLVSSIVADSNMDHSQSQEDNSPPTTKDSDANAKRNAKDPSRPRRKKARRACHACQRAHLTCGMSHFLLLDYLSPSLSSQLTFEYRRRKTL